MKKLNDKDLKFFKWGDIIVIVVLAIAIALSIYFFVKPSGDMVEIYLDGNLVRSLRLNENVTYKVNEHITVKVDGGSAFISHSDCKGQDCVKVGKINKVGEMIVCLPNKVIVKIVGKGEVDVVTG